MNMAFNFFPECCFTNFQALWTALIDSQLSKCFENVTIMLLLRFIIRDAQFSPQLLHLADYV